MTNRKQRRANAVTENAELREQLRQVRYLAREQVATVGRLTLELQALQIAYNAKHSPLPDDAYKPVGMFVDGENLTLTFKSAEIAQTIAMQIFDI